MRRRSEKCSSFATFDKMSVIEIIEKHIKNKEEKIERIFAERANFWNEIDNEYQKSFGYKFWVKFLKRNPKTFNRKWPTKDWNNGKYVDSDWEMWEIKLCIERLEHLLILAKNSKDDFVYLTTDDAYFIF